MSGDKISNHYVPRLVLRMFSNKLCLYNVKTGELQENISPDHAYAHNNLYDIDTERHFRQVFIQDITKSVSLPKRNALKTILYLPITFVY